MKVQLRDDHAGSSVSKDSPSPKCEQIEVIDVDDESSSTSSSSASGFSASGSAASTSTTSNYAASSSLVSASGASNSPASSYAAQFDVNLSESPEDEIILMFNPDEGNLSYNLLLYIATDIGCSR